MLRIFERASIAVSAGLVVCIILLMMVEIALRYLFSVSTRISEEYSGYLFCAATLIGFFPALTTGRFLRIPALLGMLPLKARAVAELIIAVISAGFCLLLVKETWGMFRMSADFGSVSEQWSATPLMYPQLLMPIGLGLLAIGMLMRGVSLARGLMAGDAAVTEDEVNVID